MRDRDDVPPEIVAAIVAAVRAVVAVSGDEAAPSRWKRRGWPAGGIGSWRGRTWTDRARLRDTAREV